MQNYKVSNHRFISVLFIIYPSEAQTTLLQNYWHVSTTKRRAHILKNFDLLRLILRFNFAQPRVTKKIISNDLGVHICQIPPDYVRHRGQIGLLATVAIKLKDLSTVVRILFAQRLSVIHGCGIGYRWSSLVCNFVTAVNRWSETVYYSVWRHLYKEDKLQLSVNKVVEVICFDKIRCL